jgi:hypothetical protein
MNFHHRPSRTILSKEFSFTQNIKIFSRFNEIMLLADASTRNQALDSIKDVFIFLEETYHKLKANNRRPKRYTYTKSADSYSFVIEAVSITPLQYRMTAYGAGIRVGDFIVISDQESSVTFTVESIDYYLDPPDLWIACLTQSELP